jgi:hypothetical protein
MAIYHLHAKVGSRKKGASAAAKAAYISATDKYRKKRGVVVVESGNMPSWAGADGLVYWKAADLHEAVNGKLYYELEAALPVEISPIQRLALAREFAKQSACTNDGQPLPWTMAVHDKKDGNPHVHILISERIADGYQRTPETWFRRAASSTYGKTADQGGARKTRDLQPSEWLQQRRESWAVTANQWLKKAGFVPTLDHRSNAARGLQRPPGLHLGPGPAALERKGIRTERGDLYRERQKLQAEWDQALAEALEVTAALLELQLLEQTSNQVQAVEAEARAWAEAERKSRQEQAQLEAEMQAQNPDPTPALDLEIKIRKLLVEPRLALVGTIYNGEAWYFGPTRTGYNEVYGWRDESGALRGAIVVDGARLVDIYTSHDDEQAKQALAGIIDFIEAEQERQEAELEYEQEQASKPKAAKLLKQ